MIMTIADIPRPITPLHVIDGGIQEMIALQTGTRQEVNEAIMNMITERHHPEMGVAAEAEVVGAIHATSTIVVKITITIVGTREATASKIQDTVQQKPHRR